MSSRFTIAQRIIESFTKNIQLWRSFVRFAASSDKPEAAFTVKPTYIHGNSLRSFATGISGT